MAPPKSDVWIYFKKLDKEYAMCKDCLKNVAHSGNTSNLRKHMMTRHPNLLKNTNPTTSQKKTVKIGIFKEVSRFF